MSLARSEAPPPASRRDARGCSTIPSMRIGTRRAQRESTRGAGREPLPATAVLSKIRKMVSLPCVHLTHGGLRPKGFTARNYLPACIPPPEPSPVKRLLGVETQSGRVAVAHLVAAELRSTKAVSAVIPKASNRRDCSCSQRLLISSTPRLPALTR